VSNIFIHLMFHIHVLPKFCLFFSIVKFSIGTMVDASIPQNIATPCILKHGRGHVSITPQITTSWHVSITPTNIQKHAYNMFQWSWLNNIESRFK